MVAADFRLTLKVKLVPNKGNSGIQFRSEPLPDGEMKGYQADVGAGWWGKLYEENGRGLLWDKSGEDHVKSGEWNHYEIVAVGRGRARGSTASRASTWTTRRCRGAGSSRFQLHSGGATEVRFRDIRLEVLGSLSRPASR